MDWLKQHPVAAIALGVVLGIALGPQLKRIPGVSKIPQV